MLTCRFAEPLHHADMFECQPLACLLACAFLPYLYSFALTLLRKI
jgi:hypothetical protein